jgi:glucosyl-3-phosphoglycerate synthase
MGDFYQNGVVTTLHNLRHRDTEDLDRRLLKWSRKRPMALVIPSLFSELTGPALGNIVEELVEVPYLNEIVIGLDRANKEEFEHAKEYFSKLPQRHRVLWHDGPRLTELDAMLKEKKLAPKEMGKGRNAWYCFGYLIAGDRSEAIALHDADILTYSRSLLSRLFYPVVNPNFNYRFCKGYYYRSDNEKLGGRVVRLLITPLIRTLKKFCGPMEFLEYLDSFRYPLAGEFSMRADVVKTIRIPSDWGLEVGILSEVQRNNSLNRICQVDIADRYDHKHQPVSEEDPDKGLSRMCFDISRAIYIKLAQNGIVFSNGMFRSIRSTYLRIALDLVEQYNADAAMNGYSYDRHNEERIVDVFAQNVYNAGIEMLKNPDHGAFIPSWKRVMSAIPDYLERYYEAVEADNAE